ncbi:HIT family protein [Halolamina salina]|uniref:HIT family protein n=1 Tax=Halolamina salina TaxID=1220023 RepID=A0ABD6B7M4_9EURY
MSDCAFCSIVAERAPAYRVYEDGRTLAFLDVNPAARGHTLVVPKEHAESITEMQAPLVGDVFRTAQRVAAALESAFEPDGINVVQSNGRAAGQEVLHAHVHVIPRSEDDSVDLDWTAGDPDDAVLTDTAATLREESDALSR